MIHNGGGFLWITSKTGYFGYMTRGVSLLRIRKEWILPAVTLNLTPLIHDIDQLLTRLLIFTAIFAVHFTRFIGVVKSTGIIPLFLLQRRKLLYTTSLARITRLYFSITYLISTILKLTVQNTMKNHQTCNLVISSRVVLSPGYRRYCGSFLWKWMKNNPFLDTSFLFSTKNPNDPDFWSDLGF